MKENKLKYYLFGLITGFIGIPLVEELMNVVNTWIQVLIIKPSKIVFKGNKELAEIARSSVDAQEIYIKSCRGRYYPPEI